MIVAQFEFGVLSMQLGGVAEFSGWGAGAGGPLADRLYILLTLTLYTVWTLLVIRALCARATTSPKTAARFIALGMLLGPVGVVSLHRVFQPYSNAPIGGSPLGGTLLFLVTLVVLLSPVFYFFFSRRAFITLSVADAFLVAFCVGLGFDLFGLLLASADQSQLSLFSLLPPWTKAEGQSMVGTGYRLGFVTLVVAGTLRFRRRPAVAVAAGIAALLFVLFDAQSWRWLLPEDESGIRATIQSAMGLLTLGGSLTPWIVLATLVAMAWREDTWVRAADASVGGDSIRFPNEWRAIARGGFKKYRRLSTLFRTQRQVEIAKAGLYHQPDNVDLRRTAPHLETQLQRIKASDVATPNAELRQPESSQWSRAFLWLPWLVLFIGIFRPDAIMGLVTVTLVAGAVILYVTAPVRSLDRPLPDDVMQYYAERSLALVGLGAALLALLADVAPNLYPTHGVSFSFGSSVRGPLVGLLPLLLVVAVSTFTIESRRSWRSAASRRVRTNAVVRNCVTVAGVLLIAWLGVKIYMFSLTTVQQSHGQVFSVVGSLTRGTPTEVALPWWAENMRLEQPQPFGNNLPAWFGAAVTVLFASIVGYVFSAVRGRIDEALIDGDDQSISHGGHA